MMIQGEALLLVRADAMPGMGSGHIMRCRALAAAAKAAGLTVAMGGRCGIPWLRPLLEREHYLFLDGECPPPGRSARAPRASGANGLFPLSARLRRRP